MRRLVDDHRQGVEAFLGHRVVLAVHVDVVNLAQAIEPADELAAVGRRDAGELEARTRLILARTARGNEQTHDLVGAHLVELVDLAQHAFDVGQAQATVEPFGKLAVVGVHSGLGKPVLAQFLERAHHDERQFDLVVLRQRTFAHHVDVGLHEFTETAFLRPFATPYLLDLPALERERQFAGMLHHIAAQRHGQVEMQAEPTLDRRLGLMPHLLQPRQQIDLLARLAFLQQARAGLDGAGLYTHKPIEFEDRTKRVDDTLLHYAFRGEPLWKT